MDIFNIFKNKDKDKGEDSRKEIEFEDDILKETIEDFEERKEERRFIELQWRLNMDFYDDNQFTYINKNTKNIEETEKMYWYQEMEVFNQIAPIIETRLAKLGRLRPIPKTRPATATDEDIDNAKVSNKLLQTVYYDQKMKDKQAIANMWSEITGNVIWKTIWNKDKGPKISQLEDQTLYSGDIDIIDINPFEIYPDSIWNDRVADCNSIIHAKAYTKEEIQDIWGKEVEGGNVNVLTIEASNGVSGGFGGSSSVPKISNRIQKDSALVIEKWERPSKKYPRGRLIICTEDVLLHIGDLPYTIDDEDTLGLPFEIQKAIKVPGRFFGKSVIERLIPLQRRYNSIKNRKAEFINRVTIGQMVYEEGSIDEDFLEEEGTSPGLMIPYRQGFNPPRYIEFHRLPVEIGIEEQNILSDFIRISGVSELSKDSQAPTGVKSGIALGILQEQDDTKLSLTASYIVESNIEIGKKILRLYKQFADTERVLRNVGEDKTVEVLNWESSNITSDDVYVDSQSASLESLAQRRNMVFDLLGTGLFNDPETGGMSKETISKVFDIIDLGNWEDGNDTDKLHISKADRENDIIVGGEWRDPAEYDDHIIHISRHNRFRLMQHYEKLLQEDPVIDKMFDYHIMQHIQFMQPQAPQEIEQAVENAEQNIEGVGEDSYEQEIY